MSMSGNNKCIIDTLGALKCWVENKSHQWTIHTPNGFESGTKTVSVGNVLTCAVNTHGLQCWKTGYNANK